MCVIYCIKILYVILHWCHLHLWSERLIIAVVLRLNAVEFVQIGSLNVKAGTVIPALIIFHFSMIGFSQRHERGNLKSKVWKPSLSLSLISYGKQTRESIWDESMSLALSLPLKVTRVIHLQFWIWRQSQILPWTPTIPLAIIWASLDQKVVFYASHYPCWLMSRVRGLTE